MPTTLDIQKALKARGFDPGGLDGLPGSQTRMAIAAFQKANGLTVDGTYGPQTGAKLFPKVPGQPQHAISSPIPWYDFLDHLRQEGFNERDDRKEIAEWASALGIKNFDATITAWCGLGVAAALSATLPDEPLPTNLLGARNFGNIGFDCDPQKGAILTFWRESIQSGKGHVGLYAAEDDQAFHVLGCNQSDAVTITRVAKARLLKCRWPKTAAFLATGKVKGQAAGGLSQNEA